MSENITSDDGIESKEEGIDHDDHEHFTYPRFKFLKNYRIKCKLMLLSGLHIGGMRETIEIGGVDNP
ncbi:hypothetical protein GF325_06350, partial [Candidatus Bathyarchaeota archaeon]|nr:hypothetical protein [Candidatus Bathyarchaeota archaeon]